MNYRLRFSKDELEQLLMIQEGFESSSKGIRGIRQLRTALRILDAIDSAIKNLTDKNRDEAFIVLEKEEMEALKSHIESVEWSPRAVRKVLPVVEKVFEKWEEVKDDSNTD